MFLICTCERLLHRGFTLYHLLLYLSGKSRRNFPLLCSELFSFVAFFFFLPRVYFFFAARMSLLPWPISFLPRAFFLCREIFSFAAIKFLCHEVSSFALSYFFFAAGIFLLPQEFLFCRQLFSFAVTLVVHSLSQCIVYWIHFLNIHTFTYQKTLFHTLFGCF